MTALTQFVSARGHSLLWHVTSLALLAGMSSSCAGAVESSKAEDAARRAVPSAICVKPLPRHSKQGLPQSLSLQDYVSIVLPAYDREAKSVDSSALDCAARPLLSSPELSQADGLRSGPISIADSDVLVVPSADDFRVVWLKTHKFSDGTRAGPIAFLRPKDEYAEVYGVGVYRGRPDSRFSLERVGSGLMVAATNDACAGAKATDSCDAVLTALLLSAGKLIPAATFSVNRVQYGPGGSFGVVGTVQYKLSATPVFNDKGIRVVEQVVVRDSTQLELRKSEQERLFTRTRGAKLVSNTDSLWNQVARALSPPVNGSSTK